MAVALGGHLPTAKQWKTAYDKNPGNERRLRSAAAWSKQYPLLKVWQDQTGNTQSASGPDIGSFSRGINIGDKEAAKDANPDGKLWLAMAADGNWQPKSGFTHLIGNAAEWVDDNGTHAVMGGSVVSPPTLPTNIPVPITSKNAAFFDVTFRLVVPLAPGGAGVGVEKFMKIAEGLDAP